jgi:CTP synthase
VTDDGAETDLDVGHYERFTDENLTLTSNITTGKIYATVLDKERSRGYKGETVQVIPHITNVIKELIYKAATDVVITEIGGTVGDIESLPLLEAIRQVAADKGRENVLYIHLTLIPFIKIADEMKSKPTQHSVKELLSIGIQPDIIVCRTERELPAGMKAKIALFCNVNEKCVIQNIDTYSIYNVPLLLEQENLSELVCEKLGMQFSAPDLREWEELVEREKNVSSRIEIALLGKYIDQSDAYFSVVEAVKHAGIQNGVDIVLRPVNADEIEKNIENNKPLDKYFKDVKGVIAPSGFGERGMEGIIKGIGYARENKIPFFGISLGFHCAAIEFARSVVGYADADTTEFNSQTKTPLIEMIPDQRNIGAMRLGAHPCKLGKNSISYEAYGEEIIYERHRHRYELNKQYRGEMEACGLTFTGTSPDGRFLEILELPKETHPWFVAVQFQPEFKSRPNRAHPLFVDFIRFCQS